MAAVCVRRNGSGRFCQRFQKLFDHLLEIRLAFTQIFILNVIEVMAEFLQLFSQCPFRVIAARADQCEDGSVSVASCRRRACTFRNAFISAGASAGSSARNASSSRRTCSCAAWKRAISASIWLEEIRYRLTSSVAGAIKQARPIAIPLETGAPCSMNDTCVSMHGGQFWLQTTVNLCINLFDLKRFHKTLCLHMIVRVSHRHRSDQAVFIQGTSIICIRILAATVTMMDANTWRRPALENSSTQGSQGKLGVDLSANSLSNPLATINIQNDRQVNKSCFNTDIVISATGFGLADLASCCDINWGIWARHAGCPWYVQTGVWAGFPNSAVS